MTKGNEAVDLKKKGGDPSTPTSLRPDDRAEFRGLYNQIGSLDEQLFHLDALRNAAERTWLATLRALRAEYGLSKDQTFDRAGAVHSSWSWCAWPAQGMRGITGTCIPPPQIPHPMAGPTVIPYRARAARRSR